MPLSSALRGATLAGLTSLLAACATPFDPSAPVTAVPFATYQADTLAQLQAQRQFQQPDQAAELAYNGPGEWRPAHLPADARAERGILLVHGLGDSPWSFHDVAQALSQQGFLVRTVLLPGHGTQPDDLLDVDLAQWQAVVREQAQALARDAAQVYLGGFSTGANLVLAQAYADPAIAGLVLFSPAFQSSTDYDWLAPWIGWARPWLMTPVAGRPRQNAVRYLTVPTNGFAQFYRSSRLARQALAQQPFERPVFMVVAEHDSVLNTGYLLETFQQRFTHPASRLVWYGAPPATLAENERVLIRPDALPEHRISQFSHMGLLFAPDNPLYGSNGSLRMCWNGQTDAARQACEAGAPVWFSDWGYQTADKVHARLTFNPYFAWQTEIMTEVLAAASATAIEASATKPAPQP